jgi:Ca-activated chloride channel family protein
MIRRCLATAAISVMAVTWTAAAQKATISVKTEEVRIDALVTNQGKPVGGLGAQDFEILDNGVPQTINYVKLQKQTPVSTTLVLDMSKSVAGELLEHLKGAVSGLLDGLKTDDHAALITFSHVIALGAPFTSDMKSIRMALDRVQPYGRTSVIDASYAGLMLAESRFNLPLFIVFSDGLDTTSWLSSKVVLEAAQNSDAVIYAVSAGRLPDKTFLRDLSSVSGGTLFEVESSKNLRAVFLNILDEFRQRYILTYTPQNVSASGYHTLKVRVRHRGNLKITARTGYIRSK